MRLKLRIYSFNVCFRVGYHSSSSVDRSVLDFLSLEIEHLLATNPALCYVMRLQRSRPEMDGTLQITRLVCSRTTPCSINYLNSFTPSNAKSKNPATRLTVPISSSIPNHLSTHTSPCFLLLDNLITAVTSLPASLSTTFCYLRHILAL